MICPNCNFEETKVLESRCSDDGLKIRRRRFCENCSKRFTTYEIVEYAPLMVVKRDNSREKFERKKLFSGILKSCEKRPVSISQIENIVQTIELNLQNSLEREVSSSYIGELSMKALRQIDEVAYIRFASVYKEFKDVHEFMNELKNFLDEKK